MKVLKVDFKTVDGERRVYPLCEDGETLATLAGHTTLTKRTIELASRLGYRFETSAETVEV